MNELDASMKYIMGLEIADDIKAMLYQDKLAKFLNTREAGRHPVRAPIIKHTPVPVPVPEPVPEPVPAPVPVPEAEPVPAPEPVPQSNIDNDHVMYEMPISKRVYAQHLLDFLRDNEDTIRWSTNLELMDQGQVIPGTDMRELVHYASRDKHHAPVGWDQFLTMLRENDVPVQALGRNELKQEFHTPPVNTPKRRSRIFRPSPKQFGRGWISLYK